MQDAAIALAKYAATIRPDEIPASAIQAAKRDVFDSLSVAVAGSSAKGVKELIELADEWGGKKEATLFVFGKKYPAQTAAAINTVMIHGYDFDDTHEIAMMHSGAIVVSCALAAAERAGGVSGMDFLAAVTVGLDIHCRLGLGTTIGIVESGYVYTPLLGIFGGVAAAGRIMGLTEQEMVYAFGTAYAQCSGNYQAITDSAWTKRIQPGFASRAAIVACEMAKKGIVGAVNTFEGKYGLYHVYLHDRINRENILENLGKEFKNEDIAFKPWPCGRPNQPPINVALEARRKFNLKPQDIKHVQILLNEHLMVAGCIPEEARRNPTVTENAQFSIFYNMACALVNGKVGLTDYTDQAIRRPEILDMAAKIEAIVDPELEREFHARVPSVIIKIDTYDGKHYEHRLDVTLGCREKPMSEEDIDNKLNDCIEMCAESLPDDFAAKLYKLTEIMETLDNTNQIIAIMQAGRKGFVQSVA